MRLIDRYLSKEFLKFLFFGLLTFVSIFILVDIFEKIDLFIDRKPALFSILTLYLLQLPYIIVLILPVAILLAVLFSIGQLTRHHELTAMKAAGLPLLRIFSPIFLIGLSISLSVLILGELAIPYFNQLKTNIQFTKIEKRPLTNYNQRDNLYYCGTKGHMYYIGHFDGEKKTMSDLVIYEFSKENTLEKRIDAQEGFWKEGKWILKRGYIRTFSQDKEIAQSFNEIELTGFEETPASFRQRELQPEEMGFFTLKDYIDKVKRSGGEVKQETVDLYLKIAFPFANFIILLFGAPLAAHHRRAGAALSFGLSLLICFLFWGIIQIGRALGHNGTLPPFFAAWLPNIVFGLIGIIILWRTPK